MIILDDFFFNFKKLKVSERRNLNKKEVKFCLYFIENRKFDDNEEVVFRQIFENVKRNEFWYKFRESI